MIRELELQEMKSIYDRQMKEDFPPEEIKPFASIQAMYDHRVYRGFAMVEDGQILAYAFLVTCDFPDPAVLVDYLAVDRNQRGRGIGSAMLREMSERFSGIPVLIESENPDFALNEEDRKKRERRISFYYRNRALDTGVRAKVYGVEYRILQLLSPGGEVEENFARRVLTDLYHTMFSPLQLKTKVWVHPHGWDSGENRSIRC